ncbi:MAG TPA: rhamnulokinase [Candidatus Pelethocola excrementipullorum]|nr:rhamnulokinase [Candidatus Pelethocola excrementipullorum]
MEGYYLAIDIGASSGRHMLGHMEDGKLILEEIHRFPNGMQKKDGELCWDFDQLYQEILKGMKRCGELGKIPISMGIDTWGVDFVLLDRQGKVLGNTVGYRDKRTDDMDDLVYQIISERDLYKRTGIQKQILNTIYQLMAVKRQHPEYLEAAHSLLMVPDYLHSLLCGTKATEYTNATTTQLVSPVTKNWDYELIEMLGYPSSIFQPILKPGSILGELTEEVSGQVGFRCKVVLPATHDTGSAVVAVPTNQEGPLYISSGTWSLMGTERLEADCSDISRIHNFANEGGYEDRFRYLKNIMGLWMIQSVKKEFTKDYSYAEICEAASRETISSLVDCNDSRFLAPESMIEAVRDYCRKTGQKVPMREGELASVIYNSLAVCYRDTVKELTELTGRKFSGIHVVGGGSNAEYLNQLTARYTGLPVYTGPAEATAIGNLLVQMIGGGELKGLREARDCVRKSFDIKVYQP